MVKNMYEQYLWLIGQIKDLYKLHVDVDHKEIHTFVSERQPVFKLFHGDDRIVVSFHINVSATNAIEWYVKLKNLHPPIVVTDVYIEDARGETYLGEDATKIYTAMVEQQVLKAWSNSKKDDIKKFVDSKVVGRVRDPKKTYSQKELDKAIAEFDLMKKPVDDDEVQ
jgi:hypothetical protein